MIRGFYKSLRERRFLRVPKAARGAGRRPRRAMSLVEMLIALAIFAVISTAVMAMITGASNTYFYVNNTTNAVSQIESAARRITHNLRTAASVSAPSGTTASSALTLVTQNDPNNGNAPYTVTYTLSNGSLVETDTRYGTNTLVTGVQTFSITRSSTSAPTTFTVNIVLSGPPSLTRTFTVGCRNF